MNALITLLVLMATPDDGPKMPPVPSKVLPTVGVDNSGSKPKPLGGEVEVYFTYGTEKKEWIEAVTGRFNDSARTLADGRRVRIKTRAFGSGEIIDGLLAGTDAQKAHLVSPASSAFVTIGNSESNERGQGDLVGPTTDLVRSPIVVAIWREQAEALGWPSKPISWATLTSFARDPAAWTKASGSPAGSRFQIAHTQPERSSSGLHAIFALAYVQSGKFADGLTRTDVAGNLGFSTFLGEFERAVPFYESSTGYLATRMLAGTPADLSAAVVYENLVIAANRESAAKGIPPRIVAIYPEEGTFVTEHPAGIVNRPWVTQAHREGSALYLTFLLDEATQAEAVRLGFRPASRSADLGDSWTAALGVRAGEPRELKMPPASVIPALLSSWKAQQNPNASPSRGQ